jgi:hypothetical protein
MPDKVVIADAVRSAARIAAVLAFDQSRLAAIRIHSNETAGLVVRNVKREKHAPLATDK